MRSAGLQHAPGVHQDDPVSHREGLFLVVCDIDGGLLAFAQDFAQLQHQVLAQRAVQRAERLVQHQQVREGRQRARQRDALRFTAREGIDIPLQGNRATRPAPAPGPHAL